jgi:hypothetical protein
LLCAKGVENMLQITWAVVKEGKIVLMENIDLPEGAEVWENTEDDI